ncbi:Glycosyl hydrolases family 2, TIM barrel domain [Mucilaginibacter pineti]|uniref:Glycosyl hydrolases family 2, TIM barrel domain n=1 Tax=Mucilaginibacter pineti TaxID=1391627 RepID=A0A1G7ETA1_9SPHI|nr:sugar-binding domain-containing protein [Mucilaginibacter pineti]SDE66923.1 Glycosyl hydrolases family 2, TIM barrel domain [Mucilaginibacter pineti]
MKAKNSLLIATALVFSIHSLAQQPTYKIQSVAIQTRWAKEVSPANALKEYPRPQLVRSNWTNLNGLWNYAITSKDAGKPASFKGQILVPYPLESALSGVKKVLLPTQNLWYKRTFVKPVATTGEKVVVNFGAVDYLATVYVNGKEVGSHEGGYTEFSFDITSALRDGENEIVVKVLDPSDQGVGPHGKQVLNPANIYYTPSSGIWQTIWMEVVPGDAISSLTITPDIDKGVVNVTVNSAASSPVSLFVEGKTITGKSNSPIAVPLADAKLWSPGNPYLYQFTATLGSDKVSSYFGMRKISVAKDAAGVDRIMLNNKPYYNLGTLDQGFWPDGLYTAPTDEALAFDIKAIKAMGFNTIRKHIKVEPARWYYHADRLGMLVWQDMVNPNQGLPEGSKAAFEKGSAEILKQLHNYPSITTWVLFNEKWGQYDQERLTKWIKTTDTSRIVNGHSGEYLYVNEQLRSPSPDAYINADITDVHSYPDPMNSIRMDGKARICGEFGGIGVFIPNHQWLTGSAWGYIQEKPAALIAKYSIMNQHLQLFKKEGLSGSIYTQPFDVEGEQNGLMTYDREVIKVPFADLRKIHSTLNPDLASPNWLSMVKDVTAMDADLTEPAQLYSNLFQQYIAGKKDAQFLKQLAMMATQAGDKTGEARIGREYIATMKTPLSDDDVNSVVQFTKSSKDAGFALMVKQADQFKKVLGDRKYTVAMMNMIYKGDMESMIQQKKSWDEIGAIVKTYGAPGEEMLLRAKTIDFYNTQNWEGYVTVAKSYLEKYGANLNENEKSMFQKAIDDHQ